MKRWQYKKHVEAITSACYSYNPQIHERPERLEGNDHLNIGKEFKNYRPMWLDV